MSRPTKLVVAALSLAALLVGCTRTAIVGAPVVQAPTPAQPVQVSPSLAERVAREPRASLFSSALEEAGLLELLEGTGPFTVLAPTDEAVAKLSQGTWDALLADKKLLSQVLERQIILDKLSEVDLIGLVSVDTIAGAPVDVELRFVPSPQECCGFDLELWVGDAKVLWTDMEASKGVLHLVDGLVWLPKELTSGDE